MKPHLFTTGSGASIQAVGLAFGAFAGPSAKIFRITLLLEGEARIVAFETPDEAEALRVWRLSAEDWGLPLYTESLPCIFRPIVGVRESLTMGPRQPRKRGSPVAARKSRMSLRRKTTPWMSARIVHSGGAEIFAPD